MLGSSFERQWRAAGTCSIHALRHALICLGVPVDARDVEGAMGTGLLGRLLGNDERAVTRGLQRLGCRVCVLDGTEPGKFRARVDRELDVGRPVILCVDDESHWLVVAGRWQGRYVWIDSYEDQLFGASAWAELAPRIRYDGPSGHAYWALVPRTKGAREARSLVPRVAEAWDAITADAVLQRQWARLLDFALALDGGADGESLSAFLDDSHDALVAGLAAACEGDVSAELVRLSWVAYCHGTAIRSREQAAAAIGAFVALGE